MSGGIICKGINQEGGSVVGDIVHCRGQNYGYLIICINNQGVTFTGVKRRLIGNGIGVGQTQNSISAAFPFSSPHGSKPSVKREI